MKSFPYRTVIPLATGLFLALLPAPQGLSVNAWYFFALFVGVVAGLIFEPLPAPAIGMVGIAVACISRLVDRSPEESIKWALGGFAHPTVWLIFAAFMFSLGYERSGLGRRVALLLVKNLGQRTLGLGYAIALSDLLLAPFMPSNTARSGGTIFPIIRNIPRLYGSEPGESARKIGSYIMWTGLVATCVTSSMFLTALAPNLLALDLIKKTVGIEISWMAWCMGFLPVGMILLLTVPYVIYRIHPPEIKTSPEVPVWAKSELAQMGKLAAKEVMMAGLASLALAFWIVGSEYINPSAVALGIVCLMVLMRVVSWEDVLSNKPAWNVLVWFATLVALADGLTRVGFTSWLGKSSATIVSGYPPAQVMVFLVILFFVTHYLFASITAHAMAMLPAFLAAGAVVPGMNLTALALLLGYSLGLVGIITPYAAGPSPIYYGSGYISRKDFWQLGGVFGLLFLILLLGIGVPYLMAVYP